MTQPDPHQIDANPTKEFFVYMLVKDIELDDAIMDLVDNCVDGARRLKGFSDDTDVRYAGLSVKLTVEPARFEIVDDCGGIPLTVARNYAFRFGRPPDMEPTEHSVGQFGVGMKRALFKLGNNIHIASTTVNSRFDVDIDVSVWKAAPTWHFEFASFDESPQPTGQVGTAIMVQGLHALVSERFSLPTFLTQLAVAVARKHSRSLTSGLGITINGIPVTAQALELLATDELRPLHRRWTVRVEPDNDEVRVILYAGLAHSNADEAGWNVYCNGREVLAADQSLRTGWGERGGTRTPRFHPQFNRFRGFVFLDAANATVLPWNTTKTGVDTDSPVYRAVREQMIVAMRPIIDFLNALKTESDDGDDELDIVVRAAGSSEISTVPADQDFARPVVQSAPAAAPRTKRIQYSRPAADIDRLQVALGVDTPKEVGEQTFDYYLLTEVEPDA